MVTVEAESIKVGVLQCRFRTDALTRLQMQELRQQIYSSLVEVTAHLPQVFIGINSPLRKACFHILQAVNTLPTFIVRRAQTFKDFKDLSDFAVTQEQGSFVGHLVENSSN